MKAEIYSIHFIILAQLIMPLYLLVYLSIWHISPCLSTYFLGYLSISFFIYLSPWLSIFFLESSCLLIYLFVYISFPFFVVSIHLLVYLSISFFIYLSPWVSIFLLESSCLLIYPFVYIFFPFLSYLSISLFIYLSVFTVYVIVMHNRPQT